MLLNMLSLIAPLLFIGLLGFKLRMNYWILAGLILFSLLLGSLGGVNLLPVLVVLFFMAPVLLALKQVKWQGVLFGIGILLPQLAQIVMINQR
ncbi:conserved hypothetical protein [Vibrio mimicus VM573]|nr:conserved hypothetical protein [Vibrio mimicus VM573]ERM53940.1 membrane protein [Vibrio mimicus CAIM 1882]ERM54040.1 membrane protein [Vibrio mimicus CAIM 1883]